MAVIGVAVLLPIAAGLHILTTHPDARLWKSSRKALFRGNDAVE